MNEEISKSPLQEKKLYLLCKYNRMKGRKVYTFSIQVKINTKNRNVNIKEI